MSDLPIVCTLSSETITTRKMGLLPALVKLAECREDMPSGVRLRFSAQGELLQAISRVIDAERQCCRFLRFELTVEPDNGPVWLSVNGPPGTREFLTALIDV